MGFSVAFETEFARDQDLLSGTFTVDGRAFTAEFYNNDAATDVDVAPQPMPVLAGDSIDVSGRVQPACDGLPIATPVVAGISRLPDGTQTTSHFIVTNPERYAAAVHRWCRLPVQATLSSSSMSLDGRGTYQLKLVNPADTAHRRTALAQSSLLRCLIARPC